MSGDASNDRAEIRARRFRGAGLLALVAGLLVAAPARAAATALEVKLLIRVAACADPAGGRPATRPPAWVDEHVAAVRALLAPHGISVTVTQEPFAPERCEVLTRAQRNAFAEAVVMDGVVTVLVVPRVRDLDVPTYDLMGVHWRAGGRRWIFLTARAQPPVLAHELCHYFGLGHDPAGGTLMTPGPSAPAWRSATPPRPFAPRLTDAQVRKLRRGIRGASSARPASPTR